MVARDVDSRVAGQFQVGDRVRRIGDTWQPFGMFTGEVYTVSEVGQDGIRVDGDHLQWWLTKKFELVQEKQEKEQINEWWRSDLPDG